MARTVHPRVPHPNDLKKNFGGFNSQVAQWVAKVLGSIWFFYFCIILDLAELPAVISAGSVIAWVTYIAQTVIQLVALPILQVYQNLQQEHNDAKAEADHQALVHLANELDDMIEALKVKRNHSK